MATRYILILSMNMWQLLIYIYKNDKLPVTLGISLTISALVLSWGRELQNLSSAIIVKDFCLEDTDTNGTLMDESR